ncbi:hypothetical protein [uncultured Clostridium sp.]|uniref:hypothetical protein n=1 Tax=uncultured Clostridium sp. TaxID=59620 RepID=UPI0026F31E65|nr:hypothetical protein [uncultured Clostridium sp.]
MNEEIREQIRQFIKDKKLSPYEVYVDYNDDFTSLVANFLKDIDVNTKSAEDIKDELYNYVYDLYGMDDYDYAYDTAINEIMEDEQFENLDREEIFDLLQEEGLIEVNYDDVLKAVMNIDLRVNFVLDGDFEDECVEAEKIMDNEEGTLDGRLGWLIQSQGHSADELKGESENAFIKSLKEEIENRYIGGYCQLVVLKRLDTMSVINAIAQGGSIEVNTNNMIGFHDPYNGAGSLLEIELEKPINISASEYSRVEFEEADNKDSTGYTVDEISGLVNDCWKA